MKRLFGFLVAASLLFAWNGYAQSWDLEGFWTDSSPSANKNKRGDYVVYLGAQKPQFTGKADGYEDFYGAPRLLPEVRVDRFFNDGWFQLGLGMGLGYYADSGNTIKARRGEDGGVVEDEDGEIELTLVPLRFAGLTQIALTPGHWLRFSGWFGPEFAYVQEVRDIPGSEDTYYNSGWNRSLVLGGGLMVRLDALDGRSGASLRQYGMNRVFLMPYVERVRTARANAGYFDRNSYGLSFGFESL